MSETSGSTHQTGGGRWSSGWGTLLLVLAGVGVICAQAVLVMPPAETPLTFWSADNGYKWWYARLIANQGLDQATMSYPYVEMDPEHRYQPLGAKFGRPTENGVAFTLGPWFPALLAPLAGPELDEYPNLARWVAVLGTISVFLAACWFLAPLGRPLAILSSLGLVLGTVCIAYSAPEVNDHLIALSLGLAGIAAWSPLKRPSDRNLWGLAVGGILMGLAGLLRNEYLLWLVCWAAVMAFQRRRWQEVGLWLTSGAMVVLVGLLAQQTWLPHTPSLRAVATHGDVAQDPSWWFYWKYRWALLMHWLFSTGHYNEARELDWRYLDFWFLAVLVLVTKWWGRHSPRDGVAQATLASLLALSAYAVLKVTTGIFVGVPHASGVLVVFPFLLLLALPSAPRALATRELRPLWQAVLGQLVLALVAAGYARGGRQWGVRYLLMSTFVLWPCVWAVLQNLALPKRTLFRAVLPICLCTMLWSGWAITKTSEQRFDELVALLPEIQSSSLTSLEPWLTDVEFLPGATAGFQTERWITIPNLTPETERCRLVEKILESYDSLVWFSRTEGKPAWSPDNASSAETWKANGVEAMRMVAVKHLPFQELPEAD